MKVGVTLPQFRDDPGDALAAAKVADATEGIDGVFVFDHLWAIGQPERPSVSAWPLLGALAATTERVVLGSLVARVTLQPVAVLAHQVETMLTAVGTDRFVAGLGAGDRLSRAEDEAFGIPFAPLGARVALLAEAARACTALGATTWVGGRSSQVREVALSERVALNLWDVDAARVRADRAAAAASGRGELEVTWGDVVADRDPDVIARLLAGVADAGASWAVCAPGYVPGEAPGAALEPIGLAARRT